jgi:hypothetical protein
LESVGLENEGVGETDLISRISDPEKERLVEREVSCGWPECAYELADGYG